MAVQYAPKMKFAGMALGGLTPNVTTVGETINKADSAGLLPSGLIGITSQHPDARKWLESRLKTTGPFNSTGFFTAAFLTGTMCAWVYQYQNVYDYFIGGQADLDAPVMRDMFNEDGVMGYQ